MDPLEAEIREKVRAARLERLMAGIPEVHVLFVWNEVLGAEVVAASMRPETVDDQLESLLRAGKVAVVVTMKRAT